MIFPHKGQRSVALSGLGWHNKVLFFERVPERKVSEPAARLGASIKVYETAGFNNPAGWAPGTTGAVNLLELADAFNIPVPFEELKAEKHVDCDCSHDRGRTWHKLFARKLSCTP
jgi:hypothetical protein